jgi:hypothetical protein
MWCRWRGIFFIVFYQYLLQGISNEFKTCGKLSLLSSNESIGDIISTYPVICSAQIPINYQLCLTLLESSQECNALVYSNARCTLYHRSKKRDDGALNKTIHNVAHRLPAIHYQITSPEQCHSLDSQSVTRDNYMDSCVKNQNSIASQQSPSLNDWLNLPPLGIVMAVTVDWVQHNQHELDRITDNWKCYAKTHNYSFVSYSPLPHIILPLTVSLSSICFS